MASPAPLPTIEEVNRIAARTDAAVRNLQITWCYHELSAALQAGLGPGANWCTFATWASRQAGQTIRKEDLQRLLKRRLRRDAEVQQANQLLAAEAQTDETLLTADLLFDSGSLSDPLEAASQAVGRGNLKVFAEIGREFARFGATCLQDETPDPDRIEGFCQELRPGEPPEGQRYLRQAFQHYYQARFAASEKARAELILLANLEIGFHEQTRLQPEIAESLDAGLVSSLAFARKLLAALFPFNGWLALANLYLRRWLGRPTRLDQALRALEAAVRRELRLVLTEIMMTITLPGGRVLRLAEDLPAGYPASLQTIDLQELKSLLAAVDPHPDSPLGSGALDWADLPERLHYIAELFRCYQETPDLLAPPFTPVQVAEIKAGRLPEGEL
jgi:hypothetical protein